MGGHVDRFFVRLVLALTLVSWASVLAHDALDPAPAESHATASTAEDAAPTPVPTVAVTPTNGTPGGEAFAHLARS